MSAANLMQEPWTAVANSSEVTTIYDANQMPICRLDLNDWGVDEDNEAELQQLQTKVARLLAVAPSLFVCLQQAAATLRNYEAQHLAKGTPESTVKAGVNAALASRFEMAIARVTGGAA